VHGARDAKVSCRVRAVCLVVHPRLGKSSENGTKAPKELPSKLLSLVSKLDAIEGKHLLGRAQQRREMAAAHLHGS